MNSKKALNAIAYTLAENAADFYGTEERYEGAPLSQAIADEIDRAADYANVGDLTVDVRLGGEGPGSWTRYAFATFDADDRAYLSERMTTITREQLARTS